MNRKLYFVISLILFTGIASAQTTLEKGTLVDPSNTGAVYEMGKNLNFSQLTVDPVTVNFSKTNVTTDVGYPVKIRMWEHNFSKIGSSVAKYYYNDSADTEFHRMDPSLNYIVYFDGVRQRSATGQEYLNVSVPSGTNLTVEQIDNIEPDNPSNPSPTDGLTGVSTSPSLSVDVSDPDGDNLNVSFYDGSDNLIGYEESVSSGSSASVSWSGLNSGTTYNWYVEIDDSIATTTSSTYSFTTDYNIALVSDTQVYENTSVSHEFNVEAYAEDQDGDSDIQSCQISYTEPDGASGTLTGVLDRSYGGADNTALCTKNLSSSISGFEPGETVQTKISFSDGQSSVETSYSSVVVPNSAPLTLEKSEITDLKGFLTDHTPAVQWINESDPDGDQINITAYTGTTSSPTTVDNEVDASSVSMNLGQNISLTDNETYYYRVRVCDEWGKCSGYSPSDSFRMNEEPQITSYSTNKSAPEFGDAVEIRSDVDDLNLASVNFTVWEGNNKIVDNENGSISSGTWVSPSVNLDERTTYNYSIEAQDNVSETGIVNDQFTTIYKTSGKYSKLFSPAGLVRDVKVDIYGDLNGQSIDISVNSSSQTKQAENSTWIDIEATENVTVNLGFNSDGNRTPVVESYDVSFRKGFKSSASFVSTIKDFTEPVLVQEIQIAQEAANDTDATYSFRTGPDTSQNGDWSSWVECTETCQPSLPENRYMQYNISMSSSVEDTTRLNKIEVFYE